MMAPSALWEVREIRHGHIFCGIGAGAKGFNQGRAEVGNLRAKFRCVGGIDVNPEAINDFEAMTGVKGTCLDLFDREQYIAFHGKQPPAGWREAIAEDIRRAFGYERPHIVFLSAPCKGFSGLLSESKSRGEKYQALNRLTLRGIWLMLEAFADDPPELIIFENVPRIRTRGRGLLDRIGALLRHYGYAVVESEHDCGEIGELAQSRKRFLLVARHMAKVPPFLYEPPKRPLRSVGEILGKMPLPGDVAGGPMHRLPNLTWKTWVRLAFVEAGSDWRSLNRLRVVDGKLADYLIVPERRADFLGVLKWQEPAGTVSGRGGATNGAYSIADPRPPYESDYHTYGVRAWDQPAETVTSKAAPGAGAFSVADVRYSSRDDFHQYGVRRWDLPAGAVTGQGSVGQGPLSIADPRMPASSARQNGIYRVVRWDGAAGAITGAAHVAGAAMSVADPRPAARDGGVYGKYVVTKWEGASGTVIGGDDSGAYGVADPRPGTVFEGKGKYKVTAFDAPAGTVIAESHTGNGAFAVADPRPGLDRSPGDDYLTGGQYGVVPWEAHAGVVSGSACHDNGYFSVQDPRIPVENAKLVAVIRALDGTWHRPFTTLELAALQSLFDPEEEAAFELCGTSDSARRERIGNAVPPKAAKAVADVMAETLLAAWSGETFQLSSLPVWVRPVGIALSVKTYDGAWR